MLESILYRLTSAGPLGLFLASVTALLVVRACRRRYRRLSAPAIALVALSAFALTVYAAGKPPGPGPGPGPSPELSGYARIYARPEGPRTNDVQRLRPAGRLERRK